MLAIGRGCVYTRNVVSCEINTLVSGGLVAAPDAAFPVEDRLERLPWKGILDAISWHKP